MTRALIISLGGSPEPVAKAILEHGPEFVCIFCSVGSVDKLGEVKALVQAGGHQYRDDKVMVRDESSLSQCYQSVLQAADIVADAGFQSEEVTVDYTGGTKTMSAATVLATASRGFRYSYVGGTQRDKGGLGIVVGGSEVLQHSVSPWEIYAVNEKRAFCLQFNAFQYSGAAATMKSLAARGLPESKWFAALACLSEAYDLWDSFRHVEAVTLLKTATDKLGTYVELRPSTAGTQLLTAAAATLSTLQKMQHESTGFKRQTPTHVADLLANALRRSATGRSDDAMARIYRALELVGQLAFRKRFGHETGNVPAAVLPESIRSDFERKYWDDQSNGLKFGLYPTFLALREVGEATGLAYFAREADFKKALSARNASILAHGFTPVSSATPTGFVKLVQEAFEVGALVQFPEVQFTE